LQGAPAKLWKGAGPPGPSLAAHAGPAAGAIPEADATCCRRFSTPARGAPTAVPEVPYNRHRQR